MIAALANVIAAAFSRGWRWLAFSGAVLVALRIVAVLLVRKGGRDTLRDIERNSRDRTINHHELRARIDRDVPRRIPADERMRSEWVRD